MKTQTEALKQRITDYLSNGGLFNPELANHVAVRDLLIECREAFAQPEQEPVAWGFQNSAITGSNRWMMLREEIPANDQYGGALWTPLYTTPPQRKPLTRGQIREIEVDVSLNPSFDYITPAEQLCRAIEAAHGIKE